MQPQLQFLLFLKLPVMAEPKTKTIELVGGPRHGELIYGDFSSATLFIPYLGGNGLERLAYVRNPAFSDRYYYSPEITDSPLDPQEQQGKAVFHEPKDEKHDFSVPTRSRLTPSQINFLLGLRELTLKYGIAIGGCGCQGSPSLYEIEVNELSAEGGYMTEEEPGYEDQVSNVRFIQPRKLPTGNFNWEWQKYGNAIIHPSTHVKTEDA